MRRAGSILRRSRSSLFLLSFISVYAVIASLRAGLYSYQSARINGTTYLLQGSVSVPLEPTYTCPYFRTIKERRPLALKCGSCAVVSNSGQLLRAKAGEEIDSHGCVFRMNGANTSSVYSPHVGNKTAVRVVSKTGLREFTGQYQHLDPEEHLLIWDSSLRPPRLDKISYRASKLQQKYPSSRVFLLNNFIRNGTSFDRIIDREVGISSSITGSSCSTGFYSMVVATHVCDSITVYGMIPPEFCASGEEPPVPYHYYQTEARPTECELILSRWRRSFHGHRFFTEHLIFERWSRHRNITFKHPSW